MAGQFDYLRFLDGAFAAGFLGAKDLPAGFFGGAFLTPGLGGGAV